MKEIAHRVDEDHPGRPPLERLGQLFRNKAEIEALLIRMAGNATKVLGEGFRVAMGAAGTGLGAARTGFQVASVHSIGEWSLMNRDSRRLLPEPVLHLFAAIDAQVPIRFGVHKPEVVQIAIHEVRLKCHNLDEAT